MYPVTRVVLFSACFFPVVFLCSAETWNLDGNGNWITNWPPTKWLPSTHNPDSPNAVAIFGSVITAPRVITVNQTAPATVVIIGTIQFDSTQGYTLAESPGISLQFESTSGNAGISLSSAGGAHTISCPCLLASNLTITQNSGDVFTISGVLGETGGARSLTIGGSQVTSLSGVNTFSGGVTISSGTLMVNGDSAFGALAAV